VGLLSVVFLAGARACVGTLLGLLSVAFLAAGAVFLAAGAVFLAAGAVFLVGALAAEAEPDLVVDGGINYSFGP